MTEEVVYDFARDNAAIERDLAAGRKPPPNNSWVIYRAGQRLGMFRDFQEACEWAYKKEIMGECTIRDVLAEPPTLGPMFGAGYEAGYTKAKQEAADAIAALTRDLEEARTERVLLTQWMDGELGEVIDPIKKAVFQRVRNFIGMQDREHRLSSDNRDPEQKT